MSQEQKVDLFEYLSRNADALLAKEAKNAGREDDKRDPGKWSPDGMQAEVAKIADSIDTANKKTLTQAMMQFRVLQDAGCRVESYYITKDTDGQDLSTPVYLRDARWRSDDFFSMDADQSWAIMGLHYANQVCSLLSNDRHGAILAGARTFLTRFNNMDHHDDFWLTTTQKAQEELLTFSDWLVEQVSSALNLTPTEARKKINENLANTDQVPYAIATITKHQPPDAKSAASILTIDVPSPNEPNTAGEMRLFNITKPDEPVQLHQHYHAENTRVSGPPLKLPQNAPSAGEEKPTVILLSSIPGGMLRKKNTAELEQLLGLVQKTIPNDEALQLGDHDTTATPTDAILQRYTGDAQNKTKNQLIQLLRATIQLKRLMRFSLGLSRNDRHTQLASKATQVASLLNTYTGTPEKPVVALILCCENGRDHTGIVELTVAADATYHHLTGQSVIPTSDTPPAFVEHFARPLALSGHVQQRAALPGADGMKKHVESAIPAVLKPFSEHLIGTMADRQALPKQASMLKYYLVLFLCTITTLASAPIILVWDMIKRSMGDPRPGRAPRLLLPSILPISGMFFALVGMLPTDYGFLLPAYGVCTALVLVAQFFGAVCGTAEGILPAMFPFDIVRDVHRHQKYGSNVNYNLENPPSNGQSNTGDNTATGTALYAQPVMAASSTLANSSAAANNTTTSKSSWRPSCWPWARQQTPQANHIASASSSASPLAGSSTK